MLRAILESAKRCEDKLAEINSKAKQLLADANPLAHQEPIESCREHVPKLEPTLVAPLEE